MGRKNYVHIYKIQYFFVFNNILLEILHLAINQPKNNQKIFQNVLSPPALKKSDNK